MGGHGHDEGPGHAAHDHGHSHGGKDLEAPLLPKQKSQGGGLAEEQVKLKKAVYFALFMMSVEIIGGILANSLAIITDAAHMLSDVGGFVVSLVCLQLAAQAATQEYTYGFKQAEVLGALMSIMIVWGLTGVLLWEAVKRLYEPQQVNAPFMFGISVLGFFVNICLMQVLGHGHAHGGHGHGGHGGHGEHGCGGHGGGHADHGAGHAEHGGGHAEHGVGHSDSHGGHGDEEESASLAMKAAIAHVIGDIVQSLGVCLAALCIWVQPFDVGFTERGVSKWNYADPCCTVLFGILVLLTTKSTLSQTINSLMVKAPPHINQTVLQDKLIKCPSVQSIHDLHVWSLGSKDVLCTAHLMVEGRENAMKALIAAVKVAKKMGIGHSTFQIEVVGEFDPALETYGFHDNPMSPKSDASNSKDGCHGHGHDAGHGHGHEGKGHDGHGHKEDHGHSHDGGECPGHGGESKAHGHDEGHGQGHKAHGHDEGHGHGHEEGHSHGGGHGAQPAGGSGVVSYYVGAPRVGGQA